MHSEQKQEIRVHIRWMIRRDMAEVLQIERESFEFPWIDEDFIRCLRQRNCIGMVAEHEGRVVGFMIYELHRTRIHVLNFAVSRICHRLGVGSQMVAKLIAKLSAQRRSRIVLEVRETNVDAQLFFRENGFRAISILHKFLRRHARGRLFDAVSLPHRKGGRGRIAGPDHSPGRLGRDKLSSDPSTSLAGGVTASGYFLFFADGKTG